MTNEEVFSRFTMMLSSEQVERLFHAKLIVFGVGGVGGALAEMLIRSGIQNLTVVDFDTVDKTNINRQLVSNTNNVGNLKVEEFSYKMQSISQTAKIVTKPIKLDENTIEEIDFSEFDYIIDCIDDIKAKQLLIKKANELKIPILCAMGAGNRYQEIPQFEIVDISKTSYDKIAKILRKFCLKERINKLNVCYTKQKPLKFDCKTIGSVIYYPMSMACAMCSKVINDIIKE